MKKSELKLVAPEHNDEIEIIITGDYNDGDYQTKTNFISLEHYEKVLPVIKKIEEAREKGVPFYNWENKEEYLTEEELSTAEYILAWPGGGDYDCHSITGFEIFFRDKNGTRHYVEY